MTSSRVTQVLAFATLAAGLSGAGLMITPIHQERSSSPALQLIHDDTMPPWVTLATTSLGSFRGLAIDVLWYRANRLKDEGQFFEANQLSQWITTLQPRFPQVWSFHAWNMAYNISVATHTPQERWDWINKGIALLRDKGIVYNPHAIRLYRELGWIFFHKIGHFMDDMQWYYKAQLAAQWHELLGPQPPGATTRQAIDQFRLIPEAPDTTSQLIERRPGMSDLLGRIRRLGYGLDETLLRQIGRARMFDGAAAPRPAEDSDTNPQRTDFDPALVSLLASPDIAGFVDPLLAYLRKRVLRDVYHMDPDFMLALMEQYGPLDWRHPAAHGCYWSEMGVRMSTAAMDGNSPQQLERDTEIDLLNTNRQSIHALQQLSWFGRVLYDPITGRLDLMPDPRFIPAYDHAMDLAKQRIDSGEFGDVGGDSFDRGHENFLLRAMADHYLYGDTDQAEYFYTKLRRLYGAKPHNLSSGRLRKPLAVLVSDQVRESMDMMGTTNQFIRAMLGRAFEQGLAHNQMAVFERFVQLAQSAHSGYQREHQSPQPDDTPLARLDLLPFDRVVAETYLAYMTQPSRDDLTTRSRAWANTPLSLRRAVYHRLLPPLRDQCEAAGFDVALAFPEPTGLDAHTAESTDATESQTPGRIERR